MPKEYSDIEKLYYACNNAVGAYAGLGFETFERVDEVHSTVFWHIVSISELTKRLTADEKAQLPNLPWEVMQTWGDELIRSAPDVNMTERGKLSAFKYQKSMTCS